MRPMIIFCSRNPGLDRLWHSVRQISTGGSKASTLHGLLEKLKQNQEAILILDLSLPELRLPLSINTISSTFPGTRILALGDSEDEKEIATWFSAGARGYCRRDIKPQLFRKAIEKIGEGEIWLERRHLCTILCEINNQCPTDASDVRSDNPSLLASLTRREQQVATLVSEGLCQKTIASQLSISEHTARNHLRNIFRKTGAASRLQLAIMIKDGE